MAGAYVNSGEFGERIEEHSIVRRAQHAVRHEPFVAVDKHPRAQQRKLALVLQLHKPYERIG